MKNPKFLKKILKFFDFFEKFRIFEKFSDVRARRIRAEREFDEVERKFENRAISEVFELSEEISNVRARGILATFCHISTLECSRNELKLAQIRKLFFRTYSRSENPRSARNSNFWSRSEFQLLFALGNLSPSEIQPKLEEIFFGSRSDFSRWAKLDF